MLRAQILSAIAVVALSTSSISAQVIFSDDFNSYGNDAALTAVWARVNGGAADIRLGADPDSAGLHGQVIYDTAAVASRLRHVLPSQVTPTDAAPLQFSYDFYDVSGAAANTRQYAEIRNSAAAAGLFAGGLVNGGITTGTYNQGAYQARDLDNGGWIQLSNLRTVGWHTFSFTIKSTTASLTIDGLAVPEFTDRAWNGGGLYDWVHIGSALTGNTDAYYDNVYLAIVPEPSTIALGAVGLLGCVVGLHRRKA